MHAKPSIVEPIYEHYSSVPVIINGPEYSLDFTYFLVHQCEDLRNLERPLAISEFFNNIPIEENSQSMEFRIIQKITSNKDHASNLYVSANSAFFKLNRHKDVLPYHHSRVVLSRSPYVTADEDQDDHAEFNYDHDEKELQRYQSACFINSQVRDNGRAFIASQAPEASSVANFLQMVWDQDIRLLVMLCQQESESNSECIAYWES